MQAVVLREFGGPEQLRPATIDDPAAEPGWVVVELRAAALNWHDVLVRQGVYPVTPLPHVIGSDGAGVRRDTGEEVVVIPSLWWGEDERAPGSSWEILGDVTPGTYAELVRVPEECVAPKPRGMSFEQAAAVPLAGLTAHRALFGRGGLQAGETVLVLGAGSGVSTFAVSLAVLAGARVLVTSSSRAKIDQAVELGADGGVLYTSDGWAEEIKAMSDGGVDLVIDSAGTWADSLAALAPGGRLVVFGATAADQAQVAIRPFYFGQVSILGTTMGSPRDFAALVALLDANPGYAPAIDSVRPLAEAAEAHAAMERREHFGKLVLSI